MKIITKIAVFMLLLAMTSTAFAAEKNVSVIIDDKPVSFSDAQPQIVNDRTMVPMRAVFEALNAQVFWDEESKTVTSVKDDHIVLVQIDNDTLFKNDEQIKLDVAPMIIDDRTMIPLRAISESFGLTVDWDETSYQVIIKS